MEGFQYIVRARFEAKAARIRGLAFFMGTAGSTVDSVAHLHEVRQITDRTMFHAIST